MTRSQEIARHARHESQRVVARKVAERVVHRLELIDVDDQQRHRRAGPPPLGEHGRGDVHESAPHECACEIVFLGHRDGIVRARAAQRRGALRGGRCVHRAATHELLELGEQRRIELAADLAPHDFDRFELRECALVAALRRERIVHVGNAENARRQRNVLAHEPVGIALAIPALVMAAHHRCDIPRELHVSQHLLAGGGMLPHERPFFVRELARLVQHFGRHDQLADVVQQRADAEPEQRGVVEAGFRGERAGEIRHTLAMTLRVKILRFNRLAPLTNHVQEVALEARHAATDVGELVA